MSRLLRDRRGGVLAEFVVVLLPFMTLWLGIWQLTLTYAGRSALDHAAKCAARSASTVLPDDPRYYANEPVYSLGARRVAAVRLAALRAAAPSVLDGDLRTLDVGFPTGVPRRRGEVVTVEVRAKFRCRVFVVNRIMCGASRSVDMVARASMPIQAADYEYGR